MPPGFVRMCLPKRIALSAVACSGFIWAHEFLASAQAQSHVLSHGSYQQTDEPIDTEFALEGWTLKILPCKFSQIFVCTDRQID